jgi:Lon protease-like protein
VLADEVLLWDWLVECLDRTRFRVAETAMVRDGYARRTEVQFTNELDSHRFERWATSRGFELEELA